MANELEQYLAPEAVPMDRPRVYIGGTSNKLLDRMDPTGPDNGSPDGQAGGVDIGTLLAKLGGMIQGLGSNVGTAGVFPGEAPVAERVRDRLLGTNGVERYQTWPEKLVRSGATLPGDVMSGAQPMPLPGLRTEDMVELPRGGGFTSPWQQPGDRVIERAQDTAGLMGGGSLGGTNAAEATLGSGPVRGYNEIIGAQRAREGVQAAIRDPITKKIYEGPSHDAILDQAISEGGVDLWSRLSSEHSKQTDNVGYVTSEGKYKTRQQWENPVSKTATFRTDSGTPGAPLSAVAKQQAPAFYSAVEHSVRNAPQPKMGYDQWMGYLKNQPGVKGEELSWMGLGEKNPFEGKTVSKEQMQEWVDNHKVEIKEVNKGVNQNDPAQFDELMRSSWDNELSPQDRAKYGNDFETWKASEDGQGVADYHLQQMEESDGGVKFGSYQLPGGENYREILFTLPPRKSLNNETMARAFYEGWPTNGPGSWEKLSPQERQGYIKSAGEQQGMGKGPDDYSSSHWDEPNVLAHTRLNDRVIDGKKSLHVEEIQSDWHQEGRKKGYKEGVPTKEEIHAARDDASAARVDLGSQIIEQAKKAGVDLDDSGMSLIHKVEAGESAPTKVPWWLDTPEYHAVAKEYKDAWDKQGALIKKTQGVPDAPFKTTWPDLVLKRLIREASEKGYDQISWTPGEAQAARYSLEKHLDRLTYTRESNGTYTIEGADKNGVVQTMGKRITEEKLADHVGKEMAQKIVDNKDKSHDYSGLDLKVGGEGMKAFYDKMLVDKANALGKKFGAKIKMSNLEGDAVYNPKTSKLDDVAGPPVFVLPITDKMRDAAIGKGFTLFTSGVPFPMVRVDGNPWKDKK